MGVLPVPAAVHVGSSSSTHLLSPVNPQGAFEDCCLAYHHRVRLSLLRQAQSYYRQDVSGSCNLPAVIFFLPQRNKMVCGRPGASWVQAGMKILDARKKSRLNHHPSTWRNFQGP
ncbi:hypothetical protein MG293_008748 [Ovis ammon polii]|uniref:C-C motif chemokine 25 n=2 Tax=Ovis TaxID=9935 RepID=A0AAD4UAT2_OVIAM|nr:hypothetical protein MG293_008748 [Ovis ammon polii]